MSILADMHAAPVQITTRALSLLILLVLAFVAVPAFAPAYAVEAIFLPFLALSLTGVGLNLLTGYGGQVSLGSAAFMAVGAFAASPFGTNLIAVRDNETAARVVGIPVLQTKLIAFALSSAIIGVAGVLWAFTYLRTVEPAGFDLDRSFDVLFIIIIGGLATIRGAFLGAALIVAFPLILSRFGALVLGGAIDSGVQELVQRIILGLLIILILILEPNGLAAILDRLSRWVSRVK